MPGQRRSALPGEDLEQIGGQRLQTQMQAPDEVFERGIGKHPPAGQLDQTAERPVAADRQPIVGLLQTGTRDAELEPGQRLVNQPCAEKGERVDGLTAQSGIPTAPNRPALSKGLSIRPDQ